MYEINDFELEKGDRFPDCDDCIFCVMRDYSDFPESMSQRINRLIHYSVENYEYEHQQCIKASECELSVWLDIDKTTKDICIHFLILDDKRKIEISGKEQIKTNNTLYSECRDTFMQHLEKFLFGLKKDSIGLYRLSDINAVYSIKNI